MIFRKTERRRYGTCFILAVGALATVGAITVVRHGKQIVKNAGGKMKSFFQKEKDSCPVECD